MCLIYIYLSSTENPKIEKQDTFVEKLVTQVIKNLQVKISNIHVRYEDVVSISWATLVCIFYTTYGYFCDVIDKQSSGKFVYLPPTLPPCWINIALTGLYG